MQLRDDLAPRILPVLHANVTTRFPYHDGHLIQQGETPADPTVTHPAFGNSFDWHSSVHSHWTALQIAEHLAQTLDATESVNRLRSAIEANLAPSHLAAETTYLRTHQWYERPYGWAWALALAALGGAALRELADVVSGSAIRWLTLLPEPIRHGVHSNTAFALGLMWDAAGVLGHNALESAIAERSRQWFLGDRDWPLRWERSGHDFLSPGLAEADLMRRVLVAGEFAAWWREFLPQASRDAHLFQPVVVPNVADGHIVHLHGLNLSRAGMLARIALALREAGEPQRVVAALLAQARKLYDASVEQAVGGDYLATHWLATFAWIAAGALDEAG